MSLYSADESWNSKDFKFVFPSLVSLLAGYMIGLKKRFYYEHSR